MNLLPLTPVGCRPNSATILLAAIWALALVVLDSIIAIGPPMVRTMIPQEAQNAMTTTRSRASSRRNAPAITEAQNADYPELYTDTAPPPPQGMATGARQTSAADALPTAPRGTTVIGTEARLLAVLTSGIDDEA